MIEFRVICFRLDDPAGLHFTVYRVTLTGTLPGVGDFLNLETARASVPADFVQVPMHPDDDSSIVEVWTNDPTQEVYRPHWQS